VRCFNLKFDFFSYDFAKIQGEFHLKKRKALKCLEKSLINGVK